MKAFGCVLALSIALVLAGVNLTQAVHQPPVQTTEQGTPALMTDTTPPALQSAVSSKDHDGFKGQIPNDRVECRDNGPTSIILKFDEGVYSCDGNVFNSGDFTVSSGSVGNIGQTLDRKTLNVAISGVTDEEDFTFAFCAEDSSGNEDNFDLCWTALVGDVDGDCEVDSAETIDCENQDGDPVDRSNLRCDLDVDGTLEWGTGEDDLQIWIDHYQNSVADCCGDS